jgi:DNA-binding NarL/FixJ family response regulator
VKILIVDDQPAIRARIRSLLEKRKEWIVCGEACDGAEAISKVAELRPDIVLMDISMPGMNGLDAARVIRKEMPDTWVVMVSQNNPEIVREQARQVNASAYVGKADIPEELVPTLQRLAIDRNARSSTSS